MSRESEHTCHALGCNKRVPPAMHMCGAHWRRVPRRLQRDLWANYRKGQEDTMTPTAAYLRAAARCVQAVATVEGLEPDLIRAEVRGYESWALLIEAES